MADDQNTWGVAIVGSGFAGSLIANELSKKGIKVVILEAGPGLQANINDSMTRFYNASIKVPESPYPPALDAKPGSVAAGRPTSLMTSKDNWQDPTQAYLDQRDLDPKRPNRPFKSTYERLSGGTSHWMGLTPRLVPADFKMSVYHKDFPDWPIGYETLLPLYERAEEELGVSADKEEQDFCELTFSKDYPMPRIPPSLFDQRVGQALARLSADETKFLGMTDPKTGLNPITGLRVRSVPAARNSQPYKNRRACAGNTSCIPICPIQAKYDATITLKEALNNGATLWPKTVARAIVVENGGVSRINYIRYEGEDGSKPEEGFVTAKVYVIAANGIETPRLLLMSKSENTPNGVANSSGMVGCNLMDHPQYLTLGLLPPTAQPVFPYRGPLVTSAIGDLCDGPFRAARAAFRISLGNDGWAAAGGDPTVTTLDFVNGTNSSGLNKTGRRLFGAELARTLRDLTSRQFRIAFAVEQSPDPKNRVTLSSSTDALKLQRPQITYDLSDYTRKGIATAFRMKKLIFGKLGVTEDLDFTKVADSDPGRFEETIEGEDKPVPLTYGGAGHVMGTYRMGNDTKASVVDSFQRSHDHHNLFLVGSGTFPTVGTANPTLTLSALALRTADHILTQEFNIKSPG